MLSVAAIVLDFVAGRARDLRRRRDHAFDPALRKLPRERVPSRTRLVGGPDRSRQSGAQGRRPAFSPLSTNIPSSPVSASRTAATILVACTSRPTRDLALAMAGSSYAVVDAARGATRTAQTPTNPSRRTGQHLQLKPDDSLHMAYADSGDDAAPVSHARRRPRRPGARLRR